MKKKEESLIVINSISELHRWLGLSKPEHPLIRVFNYDELAAQPESQSMTFLLNFYSVAIKKLYKGKLKYGQNYYDFDEGMMSFIAPNQVISTESIAVSGWCLVFHPDFIRPYPLGRNIKNYGYFSYAVNEALHLSEKEEALVEALMKNIKLEYRSGIDRFSQDVIVSHIDLLLNYCNRFYDRQFITRKNVNSELLVNVEALLLDYFTSDKVEKLGLPTVQYLSSQLNVSPNYLGDMMRSVTGQNTQQFIHEKMIEKAKESLSATTLSVSEIAYQLGFEHPQSFSKLFKNKTSMSPLEFRASFN